VFDVYTLIFLVLAVVIFLRLRSVLGRRTGHERPPFDPYARRERGAKGTPDKSIPETSANDKVVALPRRPGTVTGVDTLREPAAAPWTGIAEPGTPLARGLDAIRTADPAFDARGFLSGAKAAYEMIVTAFAEGDRKTLRPLLSPDVYDGFVAAITEREARGERVESRFIGISSADIVEASLKGNTAQVTVRFRSELVSATFDKQGEVIEGDPHAVTEVTDVWTFARNVTSRDPNWQLVATEAAD
jgi:predicted lipid-binding transport protein (Tim44 family)